MPCAACRNNFESDDDLALVAFILLHQSEGLPAFVADTVKFKGISLLFLSHLIPALRIKILMHGRDSLQSKTSYSGMCLHVPGTRDGHAKVREGIYKWLDSFMRDLSAQRAAEYAVAAIDSLAMYGFRRESDNYCRAAALLPLQAVLEMHVGRWISDWCAA